MSRLVFTFFVFAVATSAQAAEQNHADLFRLGKPIDQLSFPSKQVGVDQEMVNGKTEFVAILTGNFKQPESRLLIGTHTIAKNLNGEFKIRVPLRKQTQALEFVSVALNGMIQTEKIVLRFTAIANAPTTTESEKKKWILIPAVGTTFISYKQLGEIDYSSTVATVKVTLNYLISEKWDLGVNVFDTLLTLSNNQPNRDLKFLGANFRVGDRLPWLSEPWRLSVSAGLYYTTSSEKNDSLGYQNLGGPQLLLSLRRELNKGAALSGYTKFALVAPGFSILNPNNREIAFGVGYSLPIKNLHSLVFNADYAALALQDVDQTPAKSNTFSLSVGYTF